MGKRGIVIALRSADRTKYNGLVVISISEDASPGSVNA
jgi:hypothetical protein